ncbi:MAG: rRNA maturation RNase YbeY [bacterium]
MMALPDLPTAGGSSVEVLDPGGVLSAADVGWLVGRTAEALGVLGAGGSVSVKVVGDVEMAGAHGRWLGVAETTDVLTFDLGSDPAGRGVHADMLVCFEQAKREGAQRGHEARQELLLYIIHGILHCLGHDDQDEAGYVRMHAEEDRVLRAMGVGMTFARPAGGGGA